MWTSHSGKPSSWSSMIYISSLYQQCLHFTIYIYHRQGPAFYTVNCDNIFLCLNDWYSPERDLIRREFIKDSYLNSLFIIPLSHQGRMPIHFIIFSNSCITDILGTLFVVKKICKKSLKGDKWHLSFLFLIGSK